MLQHENHEWSSESSSKWETLSLEHNKCVVPDTLKEASFFSVANMTSNV
jgi:hypothetical protein